MHIDHSSFHAQHRDIYGLEQRDMAGRDCTCSFQPNIATACLSLGSTRRCLTEAEVDDYSRQVQVLRGVRGLLVRPLAALGLASMYFNEVWNRSHNHGIPRNAWATRTSTARAGRESGSRCCVPVATVDPLSLSCPMPKAKNDLRDARRQGAAPSQVA